MMEPGRNYSVANTNYRYGFNGQEKSNDVTVGIYTAKYWEYDSRIGRRWNVDPRPIASISSYNCFAGNPNWVTDLLGDTIRIYGNAEVTKGTLADKGGTQDQGQNAITFKDAVLVPAINPKSNQIVGYNVMDSKNADRHLPILQIEPGDMEAFKSNYRVLIAGARLYYENGEPNEGMKRIAAGLETQNTSLVGTGLKSEWRDALHDPVYVATVIVASGHATVGAVEEANYNSYRRQVPEDIHPGQQGKHIVGHNNYTPGRSILTSNPQELLDQFHSGNTTILRQPSANRITVDFHKQIGFYIKEGTTDAIPTTHGIINFGKNGAHIVPSKP